MFFLNSGVVRGKQTRDSHFNSRHVVGVGFLSDLVLSVIAHRLFVFHLLFLGNCDDARAIIYLRRGLPGIIASQRSVYFVSCMGSGTFDPPHLFRRTLVPILLSCSYNILAQGSKGFGRDVWTWSAALRERHLSDYACLKDGAQRTGAASVGH